MGIIEPRAHGHLPRTNQVWQACVSRIPPGTRVSVVSIHPTERRITIRVASLDDGLVIAAALEMFAGTVGGDEPGPLVQAWALTVDEVLIELVASYSAPTATPAVLYGGAE